MKINKDKMIITIDSELGSNGDGIARELSHLLGLPCYGKEILDRAAEISGIPARLMHRYDGRSVRAAYDLIAEKDEPIRLPSARDFVSAQVAAARQLAAEGPCILVDRHASSALADNKNRVSIFIHADLEDRAAAYAAQNGIAPDKALTALKRADRAHRACYCGNNRNWGNADCYDLSVNASDADIRAMAVMIISFLETMTGAVLTGKKEAQAV